ncbi:MAG: bifunctional DNA-formamidopyrimidine glycosylase/DNA-(apurinic or apyrimidinic site) lyase [Anaerolineae bacterium]
MPELPEVETIARKLQSSIVGETITGVALHWRRTIDRPDPDAFQEQIQGARITRVGRRGKYLLITLDNDMSLLVHLRMSGRFVLRHEGAERADIERKHVRATLQLTNGKQLVYVDPRKFGRFYLVEDIKDVTANLGPDPLAAGFTPDSLRERLSGRRGEIKRLLLNQRFIAGLGNIYANEVLWRARIHPKRIAGSLNEAECRRLHKAIVTVLTQGIRHGGTSLDDRQYTFPDGEIGEYQEHLKVYDRAEKACPRCGYALVRIVQGQRSTYFCPVCQPRIPAAGTERESDCNTGEADMETKTLNVEGMSCQMCVKHVTQALEDVAGVSDVKVDLASGTARITYDPASATLQAFENAVAEAGYRIAGEA